MKKLLVSVLPLLFCACNEIAGENVTNSFNYSYEMNGPDCSTGRHVFYSLTELCRCLQDEELNNFCARQDRQSAFVSHCDGQFNIAIACYK